MKNAAKNGREDDDPLIIIVSNRGPYSFEPIQDKPGEFESKRGAGGLVTAIGALAEQHEVIWVAAALNEGDREWAKAQGKKTVDVDGTRLRLIAPALESYNLYYNVIANPLLWFIQHQLFDATRDPSITRETWEAWEKGYQAVNRQFARAVGEVVKNATRRVIILPQDYHLYLLPAMLREMLGPDVQIQPFVHIPWPGPDSWQILPTQMRNAILEGLLASDRVGFQTEKDAFNFVQTCRFYLKHAHAHGSRDSIFFQERKVDAVAYPISIDVEKMASLAESNEVHLLRAQLINFISGRKLILRTDRIEPSKNILRGLEAFRILLDDHPEYHGTIQMLALLVPSRLEVVEYQDYLQEIMAEGGMINAAYADGFWEPVRIIVGDNYNRAIAAMELYDVLLVNPLADGMNLVAKEGPVANQNDGVLVLSENAGAFYELGEHALTVSPFDVYGTANAVHKALSMPADERKKRADALRNSIQKADIKRWFKDQIQDALREMKSSSQPKKAATSKGSEANKSA